VPNTLFTGLKRILPSRNIGKNLFSSLETGRAKTANYSGWRGRFARGIFQKTRGGHTPYPNTSDSPKGRGAARTAAGHGDLYNINNRQSIQDGRTPFARY
jgi:hypothetical protein